MASISREEVEIRIKELLAEHLLVELKEINNETSITSDLGADSLDMVELIMECEKEYNIAIPDRKVDELSTRYFVKDINELVWNCLNQGMN